MVTGTYWPIRLHPCHMSRPNQCQFSSDNRAHNPSNPTHQKHVKMEGCTKKAGSKMAKRTAPSQKCKHTAQPKQPKSLVNSVFSECPSSTHPVSDTQPPDKTTENVSSVDRNSEQCDTTAPANDDVSLHGQFDNRYSSCWFLKLAQNLPSNL